MPQPPHTGDCASDSEVHGSKHDSRHATGPPSPSSSDFLSSVSIGTALLLLEALLEHGALNGENVAGCVAAATVCLREPSASTAAADLCVSAAAMALLVAALSSRARSDRCHDDGGEASVAAAGGADGARTGTGAGAHGYERAPALAELEAVSSPSVLGAIESIMRFRGDREAASTPGTSDTPSRPNDDDAAVASSPAIHPTGVSVWLRQDGCCFGAPLRGMLDAPASLLARAIAMATKVSPSVGAVTSQRARGPPEHPAVAAAAAAVARLSRRGLWLRLCEQLGRGGCGELSPTGLACAVQYAKGVLTANPAVEGVESFLLGEENGGAVGEEQAGGGLLGVVCANVLENRYLQGVLEWPSRRGGGVAGVAKVVAAAVGAVQVPLASDLSHNALLRVQQAMHSHRLVGALLVATRVLHRGDTAARGSDTKDMRNAGGGGNGNGSGEGGRGGGAREATVAENDDDDDAQTEAALCACVELLSRLVLLSPHFSLQFLEEGGLEELVSIGSLRETTPAPLAIGALVIFSQLARASAGNYDGLRAAGVPSGLGALLAHADATVRAKACNLVGNLCRHSAFFYAALRERRTSGGGANDGDGWPPLGRAREAILPPPTGKRDQRQLEDEERRPRRRRDWRLPHEGGSAGEKSIVDRLVDLCADRDPSARKFACFAVGNAAFHSDALYTDLAPAVAPLVAALDDPEEKTRANAAGALGNLVRNGGALSADLARRGGVGALLNLAARDPAPSPRRIALFSLGTCCAYVPCREALALLLEGKEDVWDGGCRSSARLLPAVPTTTPPPPPCGGRGGGDSGGGRQRWKNLVRDDQGRDAGPLPPAAPGIFSAAVTAGAAGGMVTPGLGLDRRLSQLEQAAVGVGDDVARKYVVRLRTKLSAPPQA